MPTNPSSHAELNCCQGNGELNSNAESRSDESLFLQGINMSDVMQGFKRLFRGRVDVYAIQKSDGSYRPVNGPLSDKVLHAHLTGRVTVGLYLVTPVEDTCWLMAIDVDKRSKTMALSLIAAARTMGFDDREFLLESSGNKGFHMWFFFEERMSAERAMQLGRVLCHKAGLLGQVEVFPKQAHVSSSGFGNLIKLPGRHAKSGRYSKFFSVGFLPLDLGCLRHVKYIPTERILQLLAEPQKPTARKRELPTEHTAPRRTIPCIEKLLAGVLEGKRHIAAFRLAVFLKNQGLPVTIAAGALEKWNDCNRPPISPVELHNTVTQVYNKDYHGYGCRAPQMQEFCNPDACPIHHARQRAKC